MSKKPSREELEKLLADKEKEVEGIKKDLKGLKLAEAKALTKATKGKPTLQELEAILDSEEDVPLEILPNGEVRAMKVPGIGKKPITLREDLGGEYCEAA